VQLLYSSTPNVRKFYVPRYIKSISLHKQIYADGAGSAAHTQSKVIDFRRFPKAERTYLRFEKTPEHHVTNPQAPRYIHVNDFDAGTQFTGYYRLGVYTEKEIVNIGFDLIDQQ
jgi:hypothetical protein